MTTETVVSAMLKRTSLFGDLALADRLTLANAFRRGDVPKDTYVFHAGEPGRSFFLVSAGLIKISLSRQSREVVLAELGPGDYFGELSLIDGRPRSADAIAAARTEVLELPQDAFFRLLDSNGAVARKLLIELCRRLREADKQISTLATVDAAGRIVRGILKLSEQHARREGEHLVFAKAPRQRDIAALAGTTRATTSRIIRQLAQQGLLSFSGQSLIVHERQVVAQDNL
ncbi:MAG TPA: Crp/Fnr family transcriptional regulator [Methylomirabilota bacterium]|jgi:CRP-like cAMP-binding protein|nr:Crp/Fnr family transcriptional regulator [Methylomirabilota bacterium]